MRDVRSHDTAELLLVLLLLSSAILLGFVVMIMDGLIWVKTDDSISLGNDYLSVGKIRGAKSWLAIERWTLLVASSCLLLIFLLLQFHPFLHCCSSTTSNKVTKLKVASKRQTQHSTCLNQTTTTRNKTKKQNECK